MTAVREALFRHLQMVGKSVFADTECYPMGAFPNRVPFHYITFQRVSSTHVRHLTGGSGLASSRWQIDCWARYAADADKLADAVRKSLDNLTGTIGGAGIQTSLKASFLEDDVEDFVPPIDASQVGRARVRMDFMLWHPESVTPGV